MIGQRLEGSSKRHYPRLTAWQERRFKKLYLQGYTATKIFALLGQPYQSGADLCPATMRMRHYRKKLGLPMRGQGFVRTCDCHARSRSLSRVLSRMVMDGYRKFRVAFAGGSATIRARVR